MYVKYPRQLLSYSVLFLGIMVKFLVHRKMDAYVFMSCNSVIFISDLEVEAGRWCHLLAVVDTSNLLMQQEPVTSHR